jgi:hypothetical protein
MFAVDEVQFEFLDCYSFTVAQNLLQWYAGECVVIPSKLA